MDRCCEVSPFCARFKITKAESLAYLGRYSEAEMSAKWVFLLNCRVDKFGEKCCAMFFFSDVLHIDKQNAEAIYVRGTCLYYQDNIDQAFKHFQQVLRLAPDHKRALDIYKVSELWLPSRLIRLGWTILYVRQAWNWLQLYVRETWN